MTTYTTSAKLQFKSGEIIEIPDPGEGWKLVSENNDVWPPEWCSMVSRAFSDNEESRIYIVKGGV